MPRSCSLLVPTERMNSQRLRGWPPRRNPILHLIALKGDAGLAQPHGTWEEAGAYPPINGLAADWETVARTQFLH